MQVQAVARIFYVKYVPYALHYVQDMFEYPKFIRVQN